MNEQTTSTVRRRQGGPHPGILASVSLAILLLSLAVAGLLSGGRVFVSPFAPAADVAQFYRDNVDAVRAQGTLLFGSAVPLGIFAATVYARLLRLGVRVPGPSIGYFGGIAAAVFAMLSGLLTWLLSRPEVTTDVPLTHALAFLAFATGGVGFATGIGLLVAGLAVPSLILGFIPRWLGWTGLVLAALAELSFLSLAIEPLQFLLPLGRFGGMLWLVAVGFLLPVNRAGVNRAGVNRAGVNQSADGRIPVRKPESDAGGNPASDASRNPVSSSGSNHSINPENDPSRNTASNTSQDGLGGHERH